MRPLPICLSLVVFFAVATTAQAAIVGTVPSAQVTDMMAGKTNSYELFSLKEKTLSTLGTTIQQTNGSRVWLVGKTVYYSFTDGLYAQDLGSTATKKIRAQNSLEGELFLGKNWLISNKGTGESFFYNIQTKKITKFTPAIKTIAAADATNDKSTVIMVAKNSKGKQKLFLSTSATNRVAEFSLPSRAKSCDGLSFAPQGKTVIVACTFTVPGKTTTLDGYAIYTRSGNTLKLVTTSIKDNSIGGIVWLDDQRAIVISGMSSGAIEVHKWTIAKGKITGDEKLLSSGTSDTTGETISFSPFQLIRWTKNKFYYNMLYVYASNPDVYLTFIGAYDVTTHQTEVIVDNTNFQAVL
jgi:hypothetical protein